MYASPFVFLAKYHLKSLKKAKSLALL